METKFDKIQRSWEQRSASGDKLKSLLDHAVKTIPFYRNLNGQSPLIELGDFPMLTKPDYRRKEMYSDAFSSDQLVWHTTSGSTGEPLKIAWDKASVYGQNIDMRVVQCSRIGITPEPGKLAIFFLDDNPETSEGVVSFPSLNNALYERSVIGRDEASDFKLVHHLRNIDVPLLCARPRGLIRLMELDRQLVMPGARKRIALGAIRSSGDNLYPDQRKRLESWFGCNVFNSYQSQEGGLLAMDCLHKTGLHFFSDKSIVEVLDIETGKVEKEGYGLAVVTNLENWALPFIHYKTDDYLRIEWTECDCGYKGLSIVNITGRNSPYFLFYDKKFNPTLLNKIFERLPVHQYQVIQKAGGQLFIKWMPMISATDVLLVEEQIKAAVSNVCGIPITMIEVQKKEKIAKLNTKVQRYIREDAFAAEQANL